MQGPKLSPALNPDPDPNPVLDHGPQPLLLPYRTRQASVDCLAHQVQALQVNRCALCVHCCWPHSQGILTSDIQTKPSWQ